VLLPAPANGNTDGVSPSFFSSPFLSSPPPPLHPGSGRLLIVRSPRSVYPGSGKCQTVGIILLNVGEVTGLILFFFPPSFLFPPSSARDRNMTGIHAMIERKHDLPTSSLTLKRISMSAQPSASSFSFSSPSFLPLRHGRPFAMNVKNHGLQLGGRRRHETNCFVVVDARVIRRPRRNSDRKPFFFFLFFAKEPSSRAISSNRLILEEFVRVVEEERNMSTIQLLFFPPSLFLLPPTLPAAVDPIEQGRRFSSRKEIHNESRNHKVR